MIIPLPLASDLAAERAHELRAAATHHRLVRRVRRSRRADRAQRATGSSDAVDRPGTLRAAA